MKSMHWLLLSIFALFFFIISRHELVDVTMIVLVVLGAFLGVLRKERTNKRFFLLYSLFFIVQIMFMLLSRYATINEVDKYASQFIGIHTCRPDIERLSNNDRGWIKSGAQIEKTFGDFGYSRKIHYQDNGLLKFGFLHDENRTMWLKKCN